MRDTEERVAEMVVIAPQRSLVSSLTAVALVSFALGAAQFLTIADAAERDASKAAAAVSVIFDTDMWADIDDAMALAMLHALDDRNEINLVAITISTNDPSSVSYVRLLDDFYGHPRIPVGMGGLSLELLQKNTAALHRRFSIPWPPTTYTQRLSERNEKGKTLAYSGEPIEKMAAPEAVGLLRATLSAQPDRSVVIVQVGYSTNLARLLESRADAISALNGRELVAKKVSLLSIMAGSFGDTSFGGTSMPKGMPEFNLVADVQSAQKLFANWPTQIVVSGVEVAAAMPYPGDTIEHDYAYAKDHPIAATYRFYCEENKVVWKWSCPHKHGTADLTSVLYAARPDRNYFSLSKPGRITVLADGASRFDEAEGGTHRHLILSEEQKNRTLEAMVMLVSQPPARRR